MAGRRWFIVLAALALTIQVLVPQGFMFSGEPTSPGLVICTGHGPLLGHANHGKPGKAPKTADAPCAFAIHGETAGPPAAFSVAVAPFAFLTVAGVPKFDLAPGLGLAAPPPPSQAPPPLI